MTELEFMSIASQVISSAFTSEGISSKDINWPNVKLDHTKVSTFYEVDFTFYPAQPISLKNGKKFNGCISLKAFTNLNAGLGAPSKKLENISKIVVSHIYDDSRIVFESPELRVLDNTLSITQTTTDIPKSQAVYLLNFSFIG